MLETFGITVKHLVKEMDETFPPLEISPSMSHEEIMFRAGQRSVVEWFNHKLEEDS